PGHSGPPGGVPDAPGQIPASGGTRGPFPLGGLLGRTPFWGVPPARTRPGGAAPRTGSSCHSVVGGPAFEAGRDRSVGTIATQRVSRAGPVPKVLAGRRYRWLRRSGPLSQTFHARPAPRELAPPTRSTWRGR